MVAPARCGPIAAGSFDCDRAGGLVIRLTHRRFRVSCFIQFRKVHGLKVMGRPPTPDPRRSCVKILRIRPQPWPHRWGLFSCCSSEALPSSKGGPLPDFCRNQARASAGRRVSLRHSFAAGCKVLVQNMSGSRCRAHGKSRRGSAPLNATYGRRNKIMTRSGRRTTQRVVPHQFKTQGAGWSILNRLPLLARRTMRSRRRKR